MQTEKKPPGPDEYCVVLVTIPHVEMARKLATKTLEARLVACATLLPGVESHYWWQDKIESGAEVLMIFKTLRAHVPALEKLVLDNHPYITAEFVVLPMVAGSQKYLDWIQASVTPPAFPPPLPPAQPAKKGQSST